jgi:serine/threonine-protein kinase
MSLAPGARLGPYEILSAIGAGGMGEVYRALDSRLNRNVAIKILPDAFASDGDRLARFQREAHVLASLNHPNIAQIYGLEQSGDRSALILELIDGHTLADRIAHGPIPLDEALALAGQIADALEAAHEHGIIHRDLKPANIKLTDNGTIKVLDFGLAKALASEASSTNLSMSPTITSPSLMTGRGVILGTAAYMSPEQARGKAVDRRTDIWAFGCVLFEMVTGRRAFDGEDVSDTLAAILRGEPDWNHLPPATPTAIRRLLERCLEKDRKKRIADIADVRFELDENRVAATPTVSAVTTVRWRILVATFIGIVVGAFATYSMTRNWRGADPSAALLTRSFINVAPADQLRADAFDGATAGGHPSRTTLALSPDGRVLVFSATKDGSQQLFLRAMDRLEAVPIAGTENGRSPFFSPNGDWIGFWSNGSLRKIPLSGGAATAICQTAAIMGASWSTEDSIMFAKAGGGLFEVPASGGSPREITKLDRSKGETSHRLPYVLPGSRAVLFTVTRTLLPTWDDTTIAVQNLDTGERKTLVEGGADARYVSSGHLVYMRRGTLMAVPFSVQNLSVSSGSVTILGGVMQSANLPNNGLDSGAGQFATSASGTLAYVPGSIYEFPDRMVVWIDRIGKEEHLTFTPRAYLYPRLSPDGKRIAISTQGDRTVWIHDMSRNTQTKLTMDGRNVAPVNWTRDLARMLPGK